MPRSEVRVERKNVRIPKKLMDEVDRVVGNSGLYPNRQQFIESAIREKVEKLRVFDAGSVSRPRLQPGSSCNLNKELIGIKESFLVHTIIGLVNGKALPSDHSDLPQFKERIRSYVRSYLMRKAETERKCLTESRIDDFTECLLEYHKDILEGLQSLESI
jgi:hypothetical protein